jgi:hypothetical protein
MTVENCPGSFSGLRTELNRYMLSRYAITCLFVILATGCARTPPEEMEWPANIPPQTFYNQIYDLDARNQEIQSRGEYLTWVIRFYEGWALVEEGWNWTTQRVLDSLEEPEEHARVRDKMYDLGARISAEWSKDSANRHVFTRTISAWGQALLESINRDEEEELLDRVSADLDALFAGGLDSRDIVYERYYQAETIEFF